MAATTPAPEPTVAAERAVNPDAAHYATAMGVSVAEADTRLAKQHAAGALDAALTRMESAVLAGVWLEHQPVFRIVVAVNDPAAVPRVLARAGALRGDVEVRLARWTVDELVAAATEAVATLASAGIAAEGGADVRRNAARIHVTDRRAAEDALRRDGRTLPAGVVLREVAELTRAEIDMYAGNPITLCTSGYTVVNGTGTRGISTAGHCDNAQSYASNTLTYQAGQESGSTDAQWHTAATHTMRARITDAINDAVEPNYRMVTGRVSRDAQVVGASVCKHGAVTAYTCGTLDSKTWTPATNVTNPLATWIFVEGGTTDLSSGGDSGGPWFSGTQAYGIHHGGAGNDAVYMAVNYLESSFSLTVLTGPANDDFGNATTATGTSWSFNTSNANASTQTGEPTFQCQSTYGNTVWYKFTPPESGLYQIDTIGSGIDTVLAVYTGSSVSGLTQAGCDDNGGGSLRSKLTLTLKTNTTYRIRVGGYSTNTGALTVRGAKLSANAVPTGFTYCAVENESCSFSGTRDVIYGAWGVYVLKAAVTGPISCNNTAFGYDVAPGVGKACYTITAGTNGVPNGFTWCANEGSSCSWTGTRHVAYGHSTPRVYAVLTGVPNGIACNNTTMWDPSPGYQKSCNTKS